jgi:predicted enzyme related to lactoylglutathione lyase
MDLTKTRIVTDDVARLALFYATLVGVDIVLNDYYVEVPTPTAAVAFSRRRYTEPDAFGAYGTPSPSDSVILDFQVDDVDDHFERVDQLGVEWVLLPTTQPWGNRSMMFRDPEGNVINMFSTPKDAR